MSLELVVSGAPALAAIFLAALAALALLFLERRRPVPRRVALLVAIAALLLLYLRPALRQRGTGGEAALLLTPGAPATPAAAGAALLVAESAPPARIPSAARVAPDPAALWRGQPELGRLGVAGHGLREFEWTGFAGRVEPLAPPALPLGVADVLWRRRLDLGETLAVEGRLTGTAGVSARLTLSGPGGVEETLELAAEPEEAETEFRLRARPRTAGPHLYHLELRAEALAGAWRAPLDVEVVVPPPLRLLLVESAPSFETRHLEGLLAARGARYTLRTRVSRERYRYEYRGRDASPPRFAAAELAELDAVVADPETLAALEPGERRELRNAVAAGLGLLVLPRRGLGPWPPWSGSGLAARGLAGRGELTGLAEPQGPSGGERLSLRLRWDGTSGSPPLDLAPRELVLRGAAAPLVDDVFGRTLAAALPEGRGQIGVALPIESYRWALAGHGEVHAAYWARLLGAVARPREGPSWEIGGGPVVAGEPLPVALRSPGSLPVASWRPPAGAPEPLSLRQQALDPDLWATTLWPRPGWNRLEAGATSAAVYAAPAGVWTVVDLVRRQRDTARRSLRGEPSGADRGAAPRVRRALPRWPFYALFLAAVLYLWVGERLRPGW